MDEYIKRETALKAIDEYFRTTNPDGDEQIGVLKSRRIIRELPSAYVAPVRHGRWERDEWGSYLRRCSVCKKSPVYKDERGNSVAVYAGVCINCGAKMDGD